MPAHKKQSLISRGLAQLPLLRNNHFHERFKEKLSTRKRIIKSIKARSDSKRTLAEKMADSLTKVFGSMFFLVLNFLAFTLWIVVNTGQIEGIEPFDPFPFGLMTTVVSLEAIALAIIVLISQNRASKISDLREETALQIDLISEEEITKLIKLHVMILKQQGIDISEDPELAKMLKPLSPEQIEKALEKEID
jgi:uncharacterized membrane protein